MKSILEKPEELNISDNNGDQKIEGIFRVSLDWERKV